jgi:hypothetical protein
MLACIPRSRDVGMAGIALGCNLNGVVDVFGQQLEEVVE